MKTYLYQTALIFASILVFSFASCEKKYFSNSREEDELELSNLRKEIDKMSNQVSCENAAEWKFTAIGAKACGGPASYVAYSSKIDENSFLKTVSDYTQKQKTFNAKWDVASDCMFVTAPKGVECVSGKPKFVY